MWPPQAVRNGPSVMPGAVAVEDELGRVISLATFTPEVSTADLAYGCDCGSWVKCCVWRNASLHRRHLFQPAIPSQAQLQAVACVSRITAEGTVGVASATFTPEVGRAGFAHGHRLWVVTDCCVQLNASLRLRPRARPPYRGCLS